MAGINFDNIDLGDVKDGIYEGECAESIIDDVLAEQKIDVDAVSGATNSSNVIKKAIENAVRN